MNDLDQKRVFSSNLNRLLASSGKTQREVAETIKVLPSTFNTWCQGVALPRMGKVQLLADYFGVTKSALIDEATTTPSPADLTAREQEHIRKYRAIDDDGRQLVDNLTDTLYWQKEKTEDAHASAS